MNKNWSIFVDIDGTLFSHDPQEFERNLDFFHKFCFEYNINRFIATGRHPTHMGEILPEVHLTEGGITLLNGGLVYLNGEVISESKFNKEQAVAIYNYLVETNYSFFIYTKGRVRYTHIREHSKNYPKFNNDYKGRDLSVPSFIENINGAFEVGGVYKFLIMTNKMTISNELEKFLNKYDVNYGFSYPGVFEMNPKGVSKGIGVRSTISALDLDLNKTMCIGDGENDIGMFEQCKLSVAMENGAPRLKEIATAAAKEKGFVAALKEMGTLFLKEQENN